MIDETKIKKIAQEVFDNSLSESQYGVSPVPYHTHNGTDSPTVNTTPGTGIGTVTNISITTANGISGTVATPTTTPSISLRLNTVVLKETGGGTDTVTIQAPTNITPSSYTLTLPVDDGTSNQFLKTDGSGALSWDTPASGSPGGSNGDLQINASSAFGTIGGLNLDQTGNARGAQSLDIQTSRSGVTIVASGGQAVCVGAENLAGGTNSIAIGVGNTSSGNIGVAMGLNNTTGAGGVTIGNANTVNTSTNSVSAVGRHNTASAARASAFGLDNVASGSDGVAFGDSCTASAANTVAMGLSCTASAAGSVAIGKVVSNSTANSVQIGTGNIGFNGASYGGGDFVIFIANTVTIPTINPTGGGILYATGGALHWLGSSGTDTTLAPA